MVKTNTVMFYGYVAVIAARSILFLAVSCFEENQNLVDVMPMTYMLHSGHQRKTRFIEVCSIKLNVTTCCKEVGLSKTKAYQLLHIGEDAFREEVKKRIVAGKGQQYFINKFCGA